MLVAPPLALGFLFPTALFRLLFGDAFALALALALALASFARALLGRTGVMCSLNTTANLQFCSMQSTQYYYTTCKFRLK